MTMHLVGPYLTTTNYKKRKTKVTKAKQSELQERWHEHNKWLKRNHMAKMTYEEYIDYIHGKVDKKKKLSGSTFSPVVTKSYVRETVRYPSYVSDFKDLSNACTKKEPMKYTGTLIKGIATMHKSNAVPIINEDQAREIATMSRN